jgi:hypothetical protein
MVFRPGLTGAVVAAFAVGLLAQAPTVDGPSFEVASVKANHEAGVPFTIAGTAPFATGGRFTATNATVDQLIQSPRERQRFTRRDTNDGASAPAQQRGRLMTSQHARVR